MKKKASGSEKRRQVKPVPFRVTEEEATGLIAKAKAVNLSVSAYVRSRVIEKPIGKPSKPRGQILAPPLETLERILGDLRKVGGNLTRIANRLFQTNHIDHPDLDAALAEVRTVAARIMEVLGP